MKIRSAIHLGGQSVNLILFPKVQETDDHLALKLAAYLLFFPEHPTPEASTQHPALQGQDFEPDLLAVDESGGVKLWIECGKTTLHKLTKVTRRFRDARVVMVIAEPHEARQMAEEVEDEGVQNVEILSFADGEFSRWRELVLERNDIIGDSTETSLNLVINDHPYMTDLERIL
jgi:uncharacterized protein YaeQ